MEAGTEGTTERAQHVGGLRQITERWFQYSERRTVWLVSGVEMKLVRNEIRDIRRDQTMKHLMHLEHFFYNLAIRSHKKCLGGDSSMISGYFKKLGGATVCRMDLIGNKMKKGGGAVSNCTFVAMRIKICSQT